MSKVLAAVVMALSFVGCAEAKDAALKQFYTCKGTDPNGSTYTVYMETANFDGVNVYRQWLPNGHVIVFGEGFYDKDRFIGTQWFGGDWSQSAVMEYVIKGKALEGKWKYQGDGTVRPENCLEAKESEIPKPSEQEPDADSPTGQIKL